MFRWRDRGTDSCAELARQAPGARTRFRLGQVNWHTGRARCRAHSQTALRAFTKEQLDELDPKEILFTVILRLPTAQLELFDTALGNHVAVTHVQKDYQLGVLRSRSCVGRVRILDSDSAAVDLPSHRA